MIILNTWEKKMEEYLFLKVESRGENNSCNQMQGRVKKWLKRRIQVMMYKHFSNILFCFAHTSEPVGLFSPIIFQTNGTPFHFPCEKVMRT